MVVWRWKWVGQPEPQSTSRRSYYTAVARIDPSDKNISQTFRLGDTVCMRGDGSESWVGHLLELFQVHEDDEVLHGQNVFMRCTLRWFYGINDMNKHMISSSSLRKNIPNEVYFSDDVERDGFNDVQVIEGQAWLFNSQNELKSFLRNPAPSYSPEFDVLRIVRAFVNNNDPGKPIRVLEKKELEYLLSEPTKDKDMFGRSLHTMTGASPAKASSKRLSSASAPTPTKPAAKSPSANKAKVSKSAQKKRPHMRVVSSPSESDDDDDNDESGSPAYAASPSADSDSDFESGQSDDEIAESDPEPVSRFSKPSKHKGKDSSPIRVRRKRFGRRKIRFNRDEEDDGSDFEQSEKQKQIQINLKKREEVERQLLENRKDTNAQQARKEALEKRLTTLKTPKRKTLAGRNDDILSDALRESLHVDNDWNGSINRTGRIESRMDKNRSESQGASATRKQKGQLLKTRGRPSRPGEDHLKKLRTGTTTKRKPVTISLDSDDDAIQKNPKGVDKWRSDGDGGSDDVPIAAYLDKNDRATDDDVPIAAYLNKNGRVTDDAGVGPSNRSAKPGAAAPVDKAKSNPDGRRHSEPIPGPGKFNSKATSSAAAGKPSRSGGGVFMPTSRKNILKAKSSRIEQEVDAGEPNDMMDIEQAVNDFVENEFVDPRERDHEQALPSEESNAPKSIPDDMQSDVERLDALFKGLSPSEQALLLSSKEQIIDLGTANVDREMRKTGGRLRDGAEYLIAKQVVETLWIEQAVTK